MNNEYLNTKWSHKIGKGWYGFAVEGAPPEWIKKIDEFLDFLVANNMEFEIHQIKVKFGGLRAYMSVTRNPAAGPEVEKEYKQRLNELEDLYSKDLVY